MIQKSALIKGLLIGTACIAAIAYLRPSDSIPNSGREVDIAPEFSPLSSVTQQQKLTRPPTETAIASDDKGGDWFVIENHSGKCKPDEGPADMIKSLKTLGQPYKIKEDVVEGNRPMQVSLFLSDGVESGQMVYYRGKARCQAQADKKNQSTNSELNRYK